PALIIAGNGLFQFPDCRIEGDLLFGVLSVQRLIPGVRQVAQGVVIIEFANQLFQCPGPMLGGGQPFPLLGYVCGMVGCLGLLGSLLFLDDADKLSPVIFRILCDGPEHIGNQGQNSFGLDTVLCRAKGADRVVPILAASVLWDALAVVGTVNIHLAAAVGAV